MAHPIKHYHLNEVDKEGRPCRQVGFAVCPYDFQCLVKDTHNQLTGEADSVFSRREN